MKQIILKQLTLTNFKGEKQRTTRFNERRTTIMGANGLGKTRHMDAFLWLLFGKDKEDRYNYEVKTRMSNGTELHRVECSVEAVLAIEGEEVNLRRSLKENWVKPRGQEEQVYKGDNTECWWNDAPISITEYNRRVSEIVDDVMFKILTNPSFFANMPWKSQREKLFQLAGTVSDEEIAQQQPQYKELLEMINGKSLTEFKAECNAKKKRLKNELSEIQPRIDQTYKMKPATEDFEALRKELEEIKKKIAAIDKAMSSLVEAEKMASNEQQKRQRKIAILKSRGLEIIFNRKEQEQKRVFEANTQRRKIEAALKDKIEDVEFRRMAVAAINVDIAHRNMDIKKLQDQQDAMREEWRTVNAEIWDGGHICPNCGQTLPEHMIVQAQTLFNKAKLERLENINKRGRELGTKISEQEEEISSLRVKAEEGQTAINLLQEEIDSLNQQFSAMEESKEEEILPANIQEWVETQEEIKRLEEAISNSDKGQSEKWLNHKLKLESEQNALRVRLINEKVIARCEQEIANLEQRGCDLAQRIANIEKKEFVIQEFTKRKVEECESRINSLFHTIQFRLFDYTLDGNAIETCLATIDGVPYPAANNAARINAGLDIINVFNKFYNLSAPIFIDGAESVNSFIATNSQMIFLKVSDDNELIIE